MADKEHPESVSATPLTRQDIPDLVKAVAAALQDLSTATSAESGGTSSSSSRPGEHILCVY